MAIDIQHLSRDNKDLLSRIAPDVFDRAIDPACLDAFLSDPRHIMFLAVDRGIVVGMASAVEYFHPDKQPQLWINEVGVASTHRLRGIGRKLVEALIGIADERGCTHAWLGTDEDNKAARACFSSVATVANTQSFILFEWDLSKPRHS